MRILIVGAGAIGGYFGGRLLQAGRDVTFLVRPGRAAQLAESGLKIKSPHGDLLLKAVPTILSEEIKQTFDLILLSCKAYDLDNAMNSIAPAVGPETVIIPMLNGMKHLDALDARFGSGKVFGGKCVISVTLDADNAVAQLAPMHTLSFGERDGSLSERSRRIADALSGAQFDVDHCNNIVLQMWEKWVFLATLAASTCMMRASIGDILAAPGGKDLLEGMLEESRAVAKAAGYEPRAAALTQARTVLLAENSPLTASMLRDLENNSRVEADHVVGDLLNRRQDELSPHTPSYLRTAYTHLKAYEQRRTRTLR